MRISKNWPENPPELPGSGAAEPTRGTRVSRCVRGTVGHLCGPTGNRKWRLTPAFSAWRSISTFLCSDRQRTGTTGTTGNPPVLQRTSERTWSPLWQEGEGFDGGGGRSYDNYCTKTMRILRDFLYLSLYICVNMLHLRVWKDQIHLFFVGGRWWGGGQDGQTVHLWGRKTP